MAKGSIQERATRITMDVVRRCDLALLLVDARSGVVPEDEALVAWIRKCVTSPVLLAANKAERRGRSSVSGKCNHLLHLCPPLAVLKLRQVDCVQGICGDCLEVGGGQSQV